jgi:hypothetical protein
MLRVLQNLGFLRIKDPDEIGCFRKLQVQPLFTILEMDVHDLLLACVAWEFAG